MIDLHSHILPGVDDGPETMEGSLEIARAAVGDGITVLAATPHVRDDHPTEPDVMEERVGEVRRALAAAGIPLDVRKGGEVAIERLDRLGEEVRRFGLAGNPDYLLLEFPYYGWPLGLHDRVFQLRTRGITPVIAHPERNAEVQSSPERLQLIVDAGALVQVTAASVDGRIGRRSEEAGLALVELGLVHLLASDAHHAAVREIGMTRAVKKIGGGELGRWLSEDVPGAIVRGEPLPPRPESRRRGRFGRGR